VVETQGGAVSEPPAKQTAIQIAAINYPRENAISLGGGLETIPWYKTNAAIAGRVSS